MSGILYLCATPIGNLGDISARCLETFQNATVFDLQGRYLGTLQAEQLRDNMETALRKKFKKSGAYIVRYGSNLQRINIK